MMSQSEAFEGELYEPYREMECYLGEELVDAINNSVQQSVNKALVIALQPLTQLLKRYAQHAPLFDLTLLPAGGEVSTQPNQYKA